MLLIRNKCSSVFRAILFVVIFQLFLFKIVETATAHQHTLANGKVIVVSHLLTRSSSSSGTPAESHHHTEFELVLLQLFGGLYFAVIGLAIALLALHMLMKRHDELVENIFSFFTVSIPSFRAPPLFN